MAEYSEKNGSVDQCEESGAEDTVRHAESGSPKNSIVKSLEEEFSEAARSVVDKVAESSSVQEVEKMVDVCDPWAALKNLGGDHEDEQNQPVAEESTLPASEENVRESSEAAAKTSDETRVVALKERETDDLHENPKAMHSQPFVAASAGSRASWANCCGLLDFLKPSDQ